MCARCILQVIPTILASYPHARRKIVTGGVFIKAIGFADCWHLPDDETVVPCALSCSYVYSADYDLVFIILVDICSVVVILSLLILSLIIFHLQMHLFDGKFLPWIYIYRPRTTKLLNFRKLAHGTDMRSTCNPI